MEHSYFIFFFQWKDANENANGDAQRAKKKLSAPVLCHYSAMILIFARYYEKRTRYYFGEKILILDNNFQFPNNSLSLEKLANMNFVTTSSKRRGNHSEVRFDKIFKILFNQSFFVAYLFILVSYICFIFFCDSCSSGSLCSTLLVRFVRCYRVEGKTFAHRILVNFGKIKDEIINLL